MKKLCTLLFTMAVLGVSAGVSPPTVSTNAATSVTTNGATLNGTVNPNGTLTDVSFEYGTTTSYGTTVTAAQSPIAGGSSNVAESYVISSGLLPNTTYHYRVTASNGGGGAQGADVTFTTLAGSVCTPDAGVTSGMGPASASVPCIQQGVSFSQTYTFVIPAQVTSVTVDTVLNLPAGLTAAFSQTPATYAGGQTGCMLVTGTTNAPCGQYQIRIYVTVVTLAGTQTGELSDLASAFGFNKNWLRVIAAGGTCPAVNAAQTDTVTLGSCGLPITLSMSQTDVNCFGGNTGSATVTASGSNNYTYHWNNNGTAASITNLSAGTYSVTVTDGNVSATSSVTVGQPASALSSQATSTPTACNQTTGTASVTASGGTSGYTYLWSTTETTSTIANLAAGSYPVTVTDSKGCTSIATTTVTTSNGPSATSTSTNANCAGGTGGITVTENGGTGAITYLWSNDSTTQNLPGVSPGIYTLTITDANSCSFSISDTVSAPVAINITGTVTNTTGGNNNGAVNITATGGTGSLTYAWSNSSTSEDVSSLAAGTYTVTVTDQHTCTASASFTVGASTGISGIEWVNSFSVYPNPASSSVNIAAALTETAEVKLELFDVTGKLIISEHLGKINQLNYAMNTSVLANGVYTIRVSGSKFSAIKQLTITR